MTDNERQVVEQALKMAWLYCETHQTTLIATLDKAIGIMENQTSTT